MRWSASSLTNTRPVASTASAGGMGGGLGRFGRIESLSLDGNLLYVADSVNGRVQVMMVAPASMETGGTPR